MEVLFQAYRSSAIYARRPIIAKTAACYDVQHRLYYYNFRESENEQTASNGISSHENGIAK